jgi:hypothetical protein
MALPEPPLRDDYPMICESCGWSAVLRCAVREVDDVVRCPRCGEPVVKGMTEDGGFIIPNRLSDEEYEIVSIRGGPADGCSAEVFRHSPRVLWPVATDAGLSFVVYVRSPEDRTIMIPEADTPVVVEA